MTGRLLTCTGSCFLTIGLLIPAIPRYLTGPLGQSTSMIGFSLTVTAVTALLARPVAGWLSDHTSRATTVCAGALLLAATSFALLITDSLPLFLAARAVAGAGEALTYVGLAAASSDHKRPGKAINHFSVAVNAGLLTGPVIAEALYAAAGFAAVWWLAAGMAVVSAGVGLSLGDARRAPALRNTEIPAISVSRHSWVHPAGLRPGFGYLASVWGYTAFNAFLPLHIAALGGGASGMHYVVYGCALFTVRLAGQRRLAAMAPPPIAAAALILTAAGLTLLAAWPSVSVALCATALIGAGQGLALPTFLRMAVDALPAQERGSAVATTTAFFDIGFLSAALALGALAQHLGYAAGFALAGAVSAGAALLFLAFPHQRR